MQSNKNFDYLGSSFQLQLINQIVLDNNFARSIVDVLDSNYFENKYFKIIVQMIKEYNQKWDSIPTFDTFCQVTKAEFQQENIVKIVIDTINKIKEAPISGGNFVQEKALKFCKQQ